MKEKLKEVVNEIEMPGEMRTRIIRNCYLDMEGKMMSKNKKRVNFRKPMVAVASLVLCICVTGVTAMAATSMLQGFFKDITGWNGAVIGTSYEQATVELEVKVVKAAEELEIEVTFLAPDKAPYMAFEQMGIHAGKIVDMNGKVIVKDITSELAEVQDGKASIQISLENVSGGHYKLQISELVGSAKADQPLVLHGDWECEFAR